MNRDHTVQRVYSNDMLRVFGLGIHTHSLSRGGAAAMLEVLCSAPVCISASRGHVVCRLMRRIGLGILIWLLSHGPFSPLNSAGGFPSYLLVQAPHISGLLFLLFCYEGVKREIHQICVHFSTYCSGRNGLLLSGGFCFCP